MVAIHGLADALPNGRLHHVGGELEHHLRVEARRPAVDFHDWSYFFDGEQWIVGRGDHNLVVGGE